LIFFFFKTFGERKKKHFKERSEQDITDNIREGFYDNPNWYNVYKNDDNSTTYDVIINRGDKKSKSNGYKELISYPYDTIVFNIGDYIHWNYDGTDSVWLLISLDKQYSYNVNGRIVRCNHTLKWKNSNNVTKSYCCFLSNEVKYSEGVFDNKYMRIGDGQYNAIIQANADTNTLKRDDRFVINDVVYKISYIDKATNDGLYLITLIEGQVNTANDDLVNDIADNTGYPTWN
jgi:hypothetical protein